MLPGARLKHSATLLAIARRHHGRLEAIAQKLVLLDSSKSRRFWNLCLFGCLLYTATMLPYRLAFIEFNIPETLVSDDWWNALELVIDCLFVFDLVFCFFCTYRDERNKEVIDIRLIVRRYLRMLRELRETQRG